MNQSDSDDQKRLPVFQEKINRGDTAELTAERSPVFFRKKRSAAPGEGPTHFFLNRTLLRLNPALVVGTPHVTTSERGNEGDEN